MKMKKKIKYILKKLTQSFKGQVAKQEWWIGLLQD